MYSFVDKVRNNIFWFLELCFMCSLAFYRCFTTLVLLDFFPKNNHLLYKIMDFKSRKIVLGSFIRNMERINSNKRYHQSPLIFHLNRRR
jgi:hypothetical protein